MLLEVIHTCWLEDWMFIPSEHPHTRDIFSVKDRIPGWAAVAFTLHIFTHNWFHLAELFFPQLLTLLLGPSPGSSDLHDAYNLILPCQCAGQLCIATVWWYCLDVCGTAETEKKSETVGNEAQTTQNHSDLFLSLIIGGGVWFPWNSGLFLQTSLVLGSEKVRQRLLHKSGLLIILLILGNYIT